MGRPLSEGSTLTDISLPDSLFSSNVSEAASNITEPPRVSIDVLVAELKDGGAGAAPQDIASGPTVDDTRKLKHPPTPRCTLVIRRHSPPPN